MEVVKQVPTLDFNSGGSGCSTPYISAPSSPKRFVDFYFSAPTSPTHASAIYSDFNNTINGNGGGGGSSSSSIIPFDWEETPGTPKSKDTHNNNNKEEEDDHDFAFDFSGQLEMKPSLSSADELFAHGKIRPLKPPPRLQISKKFTGFDDESSSSSTPAQKSLVSSPRSPIKQGKKIFREAFSSPKQQRINDVDPFAVAIEQTRKGTELVERGRERTPVSSSSNTSGRSSRGSRSLSPFRVFEWKEEHQQQQSTKPTATSSSTNTTKPIFRKWRLKDFLLFRSASEGRATDKDPLRKFAVLSKTMSNEDVKTSSFRSTDSSGSVSSSKRRVPVSPHELHYTVNRAVSEELKKKTLLPYKQGLFGCLGFNPTVQGIAKGFNL